MELIHGGDWAGYEIEYENAPLDFSANVSPLGLPPAVRNAALRALDDAPRYPDPLCRSLRAALSEHHGIPAARIVCGNGASDLIDRLCRALRPRSAAVFTPCFSEYAAALRASGSAVTEIPLPETDGFQLTEESVARIPRDCELIFLANPNNPTGLLAPAAPLQALLRRSRERGMTLAVDECFLDFCAAPKENTLTGELAQTPSLVILKAFTKTHAMAGLRLGYALCGDEALAERLQSCGQPWPVSNLAQMAGVAALQEDAYLKRLRALIAAEQPRVQKALAALGLRVVPGEANFLLFYSPDATLAKKLRSRGVLIRDCLNFPGLSTGWYRAAIRTAEENTVLLDALREALHG